MSELHIPARKKIITMTILLILIPVLTLFATERTLIGRAKGFGGEITVKVMLQGNTITSVKIEEHNETRGIGTRAIDALPKLIVEKNSTEIDVISGASYTSRALLEAVDNAMKPSK